jgi:DNA-binding CsgD family transcriptional regulator
MNEPAAIDATDPVDRLIARLYRSSWSIPPDAFRDWALRQVQQIIPFDAALWGSGGLGRMQFQTCALIDLPPAFPRALELTHDINPAWAVLSRNVGVPVDMREQIGDRVLFKSEFYQKVLQPFGIERILSTLQIDDRSGLYSLISLYRRDRTQLFTEQDRLRQQRIAFHLVNANSHAFFLHLSRTQTERPAESAAAAVDSAGALYESMPRFHELLARYFPDQSARPLPFELPPEGETRVVKGLCIRTEPLADLRCVYIWPAGPLDKLTPREREIVYAIARGLSFKQAARRVGIAPSTVANHLYRVYRKLGVYSRNELAGLVYPGLESAPATASGA